MKFLKLTSFFVMISVMFLLGHVSVYAHSKPEIFSISPISIPNSTYMKLVVEGINFDNNAKIHWRARTSYTNHQTTGVIESSRISHISSKKMEVYINTRGTATEWYFQVENPNGDKLGEFKVHKEGYETVPHISKVLNIIDEHNGNGTFTLAFRTDGTVSNDEVYYKLPNTSWQKFEKIFPTVYHISDNFVGVQISGIHKTTNVSVKIKNRVYESNVKSFDIVVDEEPENDFYMDNMRLNKSSVKAGDTVRVDVDAKYRGNSEERLKVYTGYYLSTNREWDSSDGDPLDYDVSRLSKNDTRSEEYENLTIPPGTEARDYYILAVADYRKDYSETDEGNNVEYKRITVTSNTPTDTTPPVIHLNGSSNINLKVGDRYDEKGATASDNVDGDISAKIVIGGDTVNTSRADTYTVTYNVRDNAGNRAIEVTRRVVVKQVTTENHAPTLTFLGGEFDDGINPDDGVVNETDFTFKVVYTDEDNDAPKDVTLHLSSDVWNPRSSARLMHKEDPNDDDYTDGVVYTYTQGGNDKFSIDGEYSYYFTTDDNHGHQDSVPEIGNPNTFNIIKEQEEKTFLDKVIENALSLKDSPYLWGGKGWNFSESSYMSPDRILKESYTYWRGKKDAYGNKQKAKFTEGKGLDCSGLVHWAFNYTNNPKLPWYKNNIIEFEGAGGICNENSFPISSKDKKPGDIMCTKGHIAMYVGDQGDGYDAIEAHSFEKGVRLFKSSDTTRFTYRRVKKAEIGTKIISGSPIDLIVTDPDGIVIGPDTYDKDTDTRGIPGELYYSVIGFDEDGSPKSMVISPKYKEGTYKVKVVRRAEATEDSTYSVRVESGGSELVVAENIPVKDIPSKGYDISLSNDDKGNVSIISNVEIDKSATSAKTPIFRLYNKRTGAQLYARGEADKNKILAKFRDFEFTDGAPAFWADLSAQPGLTPIYRLYNRRTGAQLYTRGDADKDKILNKYKDFEFTDGEPAFWASLTDNGTTPIFRLYNRRTGMQLYTRGEADKNKILAKFHDFEFTDDGPAFYASLTN